MVDFNHINVCTYIHPNSEEKVKRFLKNLELEQPDFLPYSDTYLVPDELVDCEIIYSDQSPIGSVGPDGNEFELEFFENNDDELDSEISIHLHINSTHENWASYKPIIMTVFEEFSEVQINTLSTYYELDERLDLELSHPISEIGETKKIELSVEENLTVTTFDYNESNYIGVRDSGEYTIGADQYFTTIQEQVNEHRDLIDKIQE